MHSLKFNFTRIAFACLLLTVGFTSTASAATSQFQILLNLDNQTNTGCDVTTLTGTFNGVERILITTVNTTGSSAQVTAVETRTCTAPPSTFGPATPIITPPGRPLPWTVGVSNGTGGTSVIETFFPLTGVPSGPSANIRLGVLGFNGSGTLVDEMLKRQPGPGNGPPILMQIQGVSIAEVPTLSEWGLILLALLLAGMAVVLMKRRTRAAFLVALLLLGGAGLAWAAACDLDGTTLGEWNPSLLLADEPTSDAAAGADIRALYGCRDTGLNGLCFRIDALLLFNQNPTANDQNVVTNEDVPVGITLTGSDPDGNPLTFTVLTNPTNGVLSGTAPNLTYTPNPDFNGSDSFTFQVDDGQGGTDTGTVTITVNGGDDPPTAVNDVASVLEDAPATAIPVLANDTDPDAGPISIQSVTQPANGTVVITGGGTGLTYQPNPNYCNMPPGTTLDTFTYTLTPGGSTATVTVTVDCVNDPPVANNDAATVTEDDPATAVPVLVNDTDTEGDPFTIQSVTQPANGTVVITGGGSGLTYQPNPDYCNTPPGTTLDTFTYTLNPGGASATVSMTVTCVNDNPVAVADAATVAEDSGVTAVPVLANDTDAENDPFTIQSVTQPTNGTVVITGGGTGLTYQPNPDYCNSVSGVPDTFTYTLTPGGSTATVTMTVTCADDNPVAVPDAATVAEDSGATAVPVLANDTDVDAGPISITSVTQPANGTVVITGGGTGLTYQPNPNYCNSVSGVPDTFTYTLTPGGSTATVTMTVTCADDNPVAVPDAATVAEDSGATAIPVLANDTDPDGGPISITSVTQPANGAVVITGGGTGLTYQPNPNYCNTPPGTALDTFTYTLTPGGSSTTVTMTVTCTDDDPVAVPDAATVAEDSGANAVPVLANDTDPDGGPISITSVTQPANGTVVITGGGTGLTYQPNPNYCNTVSGVPDTFTYTLTPGGSTATVTMTVTCGDDPPAAVNDAATVAEDSGPNAIPVLANDTDVDGGPISITSVTQPANGAVVITGGGSGLTYQPNPNYCNMPPGTTPDTFTYTLTPGGSTATVSVTVTCLNDAPVLDLDADDSQGTTGSDFAVTFTEGNPATLIEDPTDATVTDIDTPTLALLTVTLTNLFDTGNEILSTDVTGTSITATYVTVPGTPGTGTLTLTGPDTVANFQTVLRKVRYLNTDNAPDTTPRVIQFVANDGTTNSNTATSTVTVISTDTNPTAVADSATVAEDSSNNAIPVLTNDTDPDGGPISIQSVTQPANGSVTITGGGTGLTYTPNPNYCNSVSGTPDTFTYTLTPGGSTATVSVTVTCQDDNPVAVADAATVTEDSGATAIPVLANDTDADGGPISITSVTQPANGTVVITGGGTGLTYAPNANYCNSVSGVPDTFTYTLAPGGSTATVTVTVTCVDDNPVAVADAATVIEDSTNNAIDVLANDTDVDGGTKLVQSVTQPANGTVVITGGGTGVSYTPNPNYCNTPPGTTPDTFTYTLTPGGSSTTVSVAVTCVDDPPVAVADAATVVEDSGANAIPVLANDTDPDAGPISITSVTQPLNGTVVITGGGTGLTYAPNLNYCNMPPGTTLDTFTYTLTPGGSSTTVTMTVTCVNDPPVADNDTFDFIGNTELRVDLAAVGTPHVLETTPSTFGVLDGDSDPVEGNAIAVSAITVGACTDNSAPFDCSDPAVGRVQMQTNGRFSFEPAPGDTGATETFQYTVTDNGTPAPASTTATVTLTRFERVWYVDPTAAAGGNGTSVLPFNTLTPLNGAGGAGDSDLVGDYIFIHDGTLAGSIELEANQHLIGEGVELSIPVNLNGNGSPTSLRPAGTKPQVTNAAGNTVTATGAVPIEIRGLSLASTTANAIDLTSAAALTGSATLTISDNEIRNAGAEGVDVNLNAGTTGTLAINFTNNAWNVAGTHTGNGFDARTVAAGANLRINFSNNTNILSTGAGASGVFIDGSGGGSVVITSFANNNVHQNTAGNGILINTAKFDANAGTAAYDQVSGGTTVVGISGNGVGGAGINMSTVSGDLAFTDLDVFADGGLALRVAGTGLVNTGTGTGTRVTVGAGVAIFEATGGAAVDVSSATIDLQPTSIRSTNSTTTGVALNSVAGTFSAGSGSTITGVTAAGTSFQVGSSNATVSYAGTINATAGTGVSLTSNTGSTIGFTGTLTLSTGTSPAFVATGGGTVTSTNTASTLTTTTGTALNVANTTIGAGGLQFRSISANGGSNGIVLDTTGSSGGLTVAGTGSAGTGGTIRNMTGGDGATAGTGIYLNNTRNVSLAWMQLNDFQNFAIRGQNVVGFSLTNSTINGVNGNNDAANEGSISFDELTGSATLTNVNVSGGWEDNVRLSNTTGTLNRLTMTNCTVGANSASFGNSALNLMASGTATVNVTVTGGTFTGARSHHIQYLLNGNATPSGDLVLTSNNFTQSMAAVAGAGNIFVSSGGNGNPTLTYNIQNNTMRNAVGNAINVSKGAGTGNFSGTIDGNTVGVAGVANSGSSQGNGIVIIHVGGGTHTTHITNNTVRRFNSDGILVQVGDNTSGGNGTVNATITGNVVKEPDSFALHGLELNIGTTAGDSHFVCASIGGAGALKNDLTGSSVVANGGFELRPRQRQSTTIRLPGYGGAFNDTAAVATFLAGQNTTSGVGSISASVASNGFVNGAACP